MNRFGSLKLRIVWASISVFLFVVFLVGFSTSDGSDGFAIHAFGATVHQNLLASMSDFVADPMQLLRSFFRAFIVWAVPFVLLATAFFPLAEAIEADQLKGFFFDALAGAANGLFYSQLLILPVWAVCARIMGSVVPGSLALADLHAVILGVQLLMWGIIFNRLICSNRGVSMVLALGFSAVGTKLEYLVDFGEMFGMGPGQIKMAEFFNHFLPSAHVPESPIAASTLLFGICGPLIIAVLLVLLSRGKKNQISM